MLLCLCFYTGRVYLAGILDLSPTKIPGQFVWRSVDWYDSTYVKHWFASVISLPFSISTTTASTFFICFFMQDIEAPFLVWMTMLNLISIISLDTMAWLAFLRVSKYFDICSAQHQIRKRSGKRSKNKLTNNSSAYFISWDDSVKELWAAKKSSNEVFNLRF